MSEQVKTMPMTDLPAGHRGYTLGEVIAQLAERNLTPPLQEQAIPVALAPAHDEESSPWYVKLLVGVAAWIAASFLGIFFGAAGLIDTWQSMFLWGGPVAVGAILLKRWTRHSIFWGQLAFALILAGQGLLIAGTAGYVEDGTTVALALIGLEILVFVLYPDTVHRLLSLLAIVGALVFLIYDYEVTYLLHGLIWLCGIGTIAVWQAELRILAGRFHPFRVPLTYGFALALLGLCILPFTGFAEISSWWPTTAGLALLLLYVAYQVLREEQLPLVGPVGFWLLVALALLLIPAYNTPGILAAMLVLILARWRSSGLLTGVATVFLLGFLSVYYYNLNIPLLEKSFILMGTGVVLLAARFGLRHVVGQVNEEMTG